MDDLSQFNDLYFQSADEHLAAIDNVLADMSKNSTKVFLETLHLHLHSLKGESYAMQFRNLGDYLTVFEKYVKNLIEKNMTLPSSGEKALAAGMATSRECIQIIKTTQKEPDYLPEKVQSAQNELLSI